MDGAEPAASACLPQFQLKQDTPHASDSAAEQRGCRESANAFCPCLPLSQSRKRLLMCPHLQQGKVNSCWLIRPV